MKKVLLWSVVGLLSMTAVVYGFTPKEAPINTKEIYWYTMEEAMEAHQKNPKKLFIDMYTDWCGWCKVMDQKTFTDPEVIRYINTNFYPVKFNAEQRESVMFRGKEFKFLPGGRNGVHELAYTLLDRRTSYPSFVLLNENLDRQGIIKGYKTPQQIIPLIKQQIAL